MPKTGSKAKLKVTVAIAPELITWVKENTGDGKRFGSVSHAFGSGILCLMQGGRSK